MERTKTESDLIFDVFTNDDLPLGMSPGCAGMRCGNGRVAIARSRDCPDSDVADLKAGYENDWREYQQQLAAESQN